MGPVGVFELRFDHSLCAPGSLSTAEGCSLKTPSAAAIGMTAKPVATTIARINDTCRLSGCALDLTSPRQACALPPIRRDTNAWRARPLRAHRRQPTTDSLNAMRKLLYGSRCTKPGIRKLTPNVICRMCNDDEREQQHAAPAHRLRSERGDLRLSLHVVDGACGLRHLRELIRRNRVKHH